MPLKPGSDPKTISENIHELTAHGSRPRSHAQIVAIALANADRHPGKSDGGVPRKAFGGGLAGMLTDPNMLLGLAAMNGSSQGMAAPPAVPQAPPVPPPIPMASQSTPPVAKAPAVAMKVPIRAPQGFIPSHVAGRTDALPSKLMSDSYVIPADIVSGLGQGNSIAGAKLLDEMFAMYGMNPNVGFKRGGAAKKPEPPQATNVLLAGGEYRVPPEVVQSIGQGDMSAGHKLLDKMVLNIRAHNIKTLKKLPPPRK